MTSPNLPKLVLCELGETNVPGLESYSPFCLKVHRGLKYLGLSYERRHGIPSSFKKYHATGQVPVLLIGDTEAVGDSTDILKRLQTLAGRTFHGTDDAKLAAEGVLWEEFADNALAGFFMAARWADERNWPRLRDVIFGNMPGVLKSVIGAQVRNRIVKGLVARDIWRAGPEVCWRRFQETLDALEARAPEEGFWLGTFSTADISLFALLHGLRNELTPWQRDLIAARPRLSRYLDRVDAATGGTGSAGASRSSAA
ncbi:glutathione S-transferase family protein [Archangium sp.]|jgi:glutathione S-transferase|uniref:glutathione S-transferase family protein n=1 Tax=Archangium sp. TaxID=1872627 RepID=UPI002EDBB34C